MEQWVDMRKIATIALVLCLFLTSCSRSEKQPVINEPNRRNQEGDVCFSEHAAPFIEDFSKEYPDMKVTKVRWQMLPEGGETYIVEGIENEQKSIVKYHIGSKMVLGRVERELKESEIIDGVCKEKPLVMESMLTFTEMSDIAVEELGGEVFEINVSWKKETPVAYIEVIYDDFHVDNITICAVTGEILK